MKNYIILKIYRTEGYEDVHDDIMLDDFLETPREFEIELIDGSSKGGGGMSRIEDLKIRNDAISSDGYYHVSESDFLWLLDIVEASVMTRNMVEACFGMTIDETLTIYLDNVLEDNREPD